MNEDNTSTRIASPVININTSSQILNNADNQKQNNVDILSPKKEISPIPSPRSRTAKTFSGMKK